ncbi:MULTISPECIES: DUF655 domain-containing protein [Metallosphaera]|uniref:RNA-binding protein n=3 Tax=Metallosphaera TaxID=41980 RepID=A4YCT8_METS5|nr:MULTISPECIES: DUF655 domain-containing protein [Metallosphaera]ABP94240.1 protein of unknown function DUF655 [Metallosphaera sedula DSM 5348]AIM26227.1 protein of unknown function DUF655 [Metallosphaera sedula]AKV73248.1 RNA-binding protein [Metallosphaera sedula]AKV75492.1 RNA-binding protein [Metallosphaera sedula]AKV77738.1 RNA-binding protein [Metallosphaera sedula]
MSKRGPRERYVYVLDHLREGNPLDKHKWHKNKPLVQVIGEDYFILMEAFPLTEQIQIEERIDRDQEPPVLKVDVLIDYEDLTSLAKDNLGKILEKIVTAKESQFVNFFNKAEPLTLKLHALELLPDIGKKTLRTILEERKRLPFSSFADIETRVGIKNVKEILVKRLLIEIKREDKYFLFVYPGESERGIEGERKPQEQKYIGYLERLKQG